MFSDPKTALLTFESLGRKLRAEIENMVFSENVRWENVTGLFKLGSTAVASYQGDSRTAPFTPV